jgi:hypothetical protein
MTTVVSIPDDDAPDEVTDAVDEVCGQLGRPGDRSDGFVSSAARRILERTEW